MLICIQIYKLVESPFTDSCPMKYELSIIIAITIFNFLEIGSVTHLLTYSLTLSTITKTVHF